MNAAVSCLHHCDGNPNLDIAVFLGVGLTSLVGEENSNPLQGVLCLCAREDIYRGNKSGEVLLLLESHLRILKFFFIRDLGTLLRRSLQVGYGFSIHETHVLNDVCDILSYYLDEKFSLILQSICNLCRVVE